jgi:flagellar motor switch protein FliN/FliY
MTDILSQDEIDKLLKSGIGGGDSGDDNYSEPSPKPKKSAQPASFASSSFSQSFDHNLPSFDSIKGLKKSANMRRSSVVDDDRKINVHPASFPTFDVYEPPSENTELGTILDIKLEIRVQLGHTKSTIRQVLDMGTGSVIELDKQNGEPVDMVVNKKAFAKGEMIVIGENFGARITDILSVHEIIEALR